MALEEIEKLRQKVEKDPGSRLFLPLAEEYRKAGMTDEAIAALLGGLEKHPGYTSARVALGRIYLEKALLEEARAEFEKVVQVVPDNLFAHRKLADIYREAGELERACAEYRRVLALNPSDEDAKSCLEGVEDTLASEAAASFAVPGTEAPAASDKAKATGLEEALKEPEPFPPDPEVFDLDSSDAFSAPALGEDFEEFSRTLSIELQGAPGVDEARPAAVPPPEAAPSLAAALPAAAAEPEPERVVPSAAEAAEPLIPDHSATDRLVSEGRFAEAFDAYRRLLADDPQNNEILQRLEELKVYIKMLGKGDEVLIGRLEAFLEGVKICFSRRA
jgi:tetratricopeptide (TPR) repeat protein